MATGSRTSVRHEPVRHEPARPDHDVVVVGAGFSGIGAAIKLGQAGIDYVVLEQSDGVGGTWHLNTYPGVAVDIPSFAYSFSFEQSQRWSRTYAPGAELKAYANHCVDKHDVRRHIRFDTRVVNAAFDEDNDLWHVTTASGETLVTRHVIYALGPFGEPKMPDIAGIESFAGTRIHTARWDHSQDLTGRRVAIIGTGASAVQVVPSIAPDVAHLTVFQRTPIWVMPRVDLPLSATSHALLKRVPFTRPAARLASQALVEATFVLAGQYNKTVPWIVSAGSQVGRTYLRQQVKDPVLRAKLTPNYPLGCKRPSFSNTYLATFNRSNVTLETDPIAEIVPDGIRTAAGHHHEFDTLILATGFNLFEKSSSPAFTVTGRNGTDLSEWWATNRFQAYRGVSVPEFPNMFSIMGPYGYNGSSYFELIENQLTHIIRCLTTARSRGATRVEVTPQANERYFRSMLERRDRQVFFNQDCSGSNSYYFDQHGDVPFLSATTVQTRWHSAHFDLADYSFAGRDH